MRKTVLNAQRLKKHEFYGDQNGINGQKLIFTAFLVIFQRIKSVRAPLPVLVTLLAPALFSKDHWRNGISPDQNKFRIGTEQLNTNPALD